MTTYIIPAPTYSGGETAPVFATPVDASTVSMAAGGSVGTNGSVSNGLSDPGLAALQFEANQLAPPSF